MPDKTTTPHIERECRPAKPFDEDNDFHEMWWDSVAGGDAPKGRPKVPLHAVWQYMGDAMEPWWARPGDAEIYEEGWRWVRMVALLDEPRMDGEPPNAALSSTREPSEEEIEAGIAAAKRRFFSARRSITTRRISKKK